MLKVKWESRNVDGEILCLNQREVYQYFMGKCCMTFRHKIITSSKIMLKTV